MEQPPLDADHFFFFNGQLQSNEAFKKPTAAL
jgi:hypothetical protein